MHWVTIEFGSWGLTTLGIARRLMREPQLRARLRLADTPEQAPGPGVLRIESASLVRPLVTVLWGDEPAHEPSAEDLCVALSREVWSDVQTPESWRLTAGPLPRGLRLGETDPDRPWVLIAPGVATTLAQVEALSKLQDAQLHVLGMSSPKDDRHVVRWLPRRRVICSLLGQVDAVIAPPGPLAWDAARVGVPVFDPASAPGLPPELAARRLARTVPAALVGDPGFWEQLARDVSSGVRSPRWGTIRWLLQAREKPRTVANTKFSGPSNLNRKLGKLRRDPRAFWSDSWLAHVVERRFHRK